MLKYINGHIIKELMQKHLIQHKPTTTVHNTKEVETKVYTSLLEHVYSQIDIALLSSLFCGAIIFIALYNPWANNSKLIIYSIVFVAVTIIRAILSRLYHRQQSQNINVWHSLYILGSVLGGITWGLTAIFLLSAAPYDQILLVCMLAGVTAGSVPLSAAIPQASIGFLITALVPYIAVLIFANNSIYHLLTLALTLYLGYSIVLTLRTYKLIKSSIVLKYENDMLLKNLEMTNQRLEKAATLDPLTQVPNRRLFEENFASAIDRAKNRKMTLALFYIDLDHFRKANDKYGHYAGDFILKTVIDRMRVFFRKEDVIARIGDDEMVVLIERVNDFEELLKIAVKICQIIALPIEMKNLTLQISGSVGISIYPNDADTAESMLKAAYHAVLYVKEQGGNNYHFHSHLEEELNA